MKKMTTLTLLAVLTIAVWLPVGASAQEWQRRQIQRSTIYYGNGQNDEYWRERRRRMRRMRARMMNQSTYGYPSYATNRRFRLERQTYYMNGRRYTRTVRVYF